MSEQIQSIVEAVRRLDVAQRRELTSALAAVEPLPANPSNSRKQLIDSVRGKYRHIPTSSDSFMNRKREDTISESER